MVNLPIVGNLPITAKGFPIVVRGFPNHTTVQCGWYHLFLITDQNNISLRCLQAGWSLGVLVFVICNSKVYHTLYVS